MKNKKERVEISEDMDIAKATAVTMRLAEAAGFSPNQQFMVATATSELARNIFTYAMRGEITIRVLNREIRVLNRESKKGIEVVAEDNGPGIADIGAAMKDHFSTSEGLGLGLPGTKRLMDEFIIDTERPVGTRITVRKWV